MTCRWKKFPASLSDHYDPTKRALFLSSDNFHGQTVAAVGVAAHEAGHALQHQAAYGLFNVRMALVPVTQFASMAYMGILFSGIFMNILDRPCCDRHWNIFSDHPVPTRHAAGGIRRQPPREGAIVPARPRA